MRKLPELGTGAVGLLDEDAVQGQDVEVRIESKVRVDSLHRGHRAALQLAPSGLGTLSCPSGVQQLDKEPFARASADISEIAQ